MSKFEQVVEIMSRLRAPGGCPWDREQTHESLKSYMIEEAYELLEAIDEQNDRDIRDELGDVLLQVVFHAQLAAEENRFDIEDVAGAISEKLIRRHPHIFGDTRAEDANRVLQNWEAIKSQENKDKGDRDSVLGGIPRALPALQRARRTQERASRVGFDWEEAGEVAKKVKEEVDEFLEAHSSGDRPHAEEELGDILFALVNLSRFMKICPEEALRKTIGKFEKRFHYIEEELEKQDKSPRTASLEEMDQLWEKAKDIR
ncbi:MAG: nucleoside triphosphate pyrophosphohydrolase [Planctomycetota bacterium]|nr:nucleoside triphosphate pyrophosphohydrolase [Planctomycetota bacterium]